jgi:hypothetical protein
MPNIETDYLVIGAGAAAMAFVDTLVTETDATVVMVDRNGQPGGHWTTAYPFVRLHQPSAYYGVNSRMLGSDAIDRVGANEGFYELAGAAEVLAYFDAVMNHHLLPSGRVRYHPMSEYLGDGRVRTLAGDEFEVVAKRVVDSTNVGVVVPSMRPPPFIVDGADCIAPNELPSVKRARDRYVIVGAGKTAMDACLWLLRHDIPPERLTWIRPRDSWLLDRGAVQPGRKFASRMLGDIAGQLKSVEEADGLDDLFERLESAGCLLRIDQSVDPQMYRCAIVSQHELEQLRRITDVVRAGHVTSISRGLVELEDGSVTVDGSALYIDCAADGLGKNDVAKIFDGDLITLHSVRTCQPTFSAAVIAHVEATYADEDTKNAYCVPVPFPHVPRDWMRMMLGNNTNQLRWFADPDMMAWLDGSRLNALSHTTAEVSQRAKERMVSTLAAQFTAANSKLEKLLAL